MDRVFSNAVISGTYSFHASASAYTEFWNNSFGDQGFELSRHQIWQSFVQESIRTIAAESKTNLELRNNLHINDVTQQAFQNLGNNGILQSAHGHSCSDCTHAFKAQQDSIPDQVHPIDPTAAPVSMVVVDGIVMGPTHCAFDGCSQQLANSRGGAFCAYHEQVFGNKCRVRDCQEDQVPETQACETHREDWNKYLNDHSRTNLSGVRRMLQRPNENEAWNTGTRIVHRTRPHDAITDEDEDDNSATTSRKNFFGHAWFYCVETITASCGVVIAWDKFVKSESETKILAFLEKVYPNPASRPSYIAIDKACKLLRRAITTGAWNIWRLTSRFIVDSYHYNNHKATDSLCSTWCNPAPTNGTAPNLVTMTRDKIGRAVWKRDFNTQVSKFTNNKMYITNLSSRQLSS